MRNQALDFSILGVLAAACAALALGPVSPAHAKDPGDLAGTWELSVGKTGASCRVMLQAERSDTGDYFLGMAPACRHTIPELASVGRWAQPDDTHLVLNAPGGRPVVNLAAAGDGYVNTDGGGYRMTRVGAPQSARSVALMDRSASAPATGSADTAPRIERIATHAAKEAPVSSADVAGRYAVMREKRDTGCMLTLDRTHAKGGDRAQLAPGCRDQGIVIFDPTSWQIVHGELVLTARAGHKAKLAPAGDGDWAKDPKDGGKPLGLKRL